MVCRHQRERRALGLARTNVLLAIAVVSCGLIGSLIAGLRNPSQLRFRSAVLGLAAGFVAFLTIRGGKAILLAESAGDVPLLNPYSLALVGLLAGLFTERGYELLSEVVDNFIERVKVAVAAPAPRPDEAPKIDAPGPQEIERQPSTNGSPAVNNGHWQKLERRDSKPPSVAPPA